MVRICPLLQVFANFDVFFGHADISDPVVASKFWAWIDFDLYDASQPFHGAVWTPRDKVTP